MRRQQQVALPFSPPAVVSLGVASWPCLQKGLSHIILNPGAAVRAGRQKGLNHGKVSSESKADNAAKIL